ncbi:MAG: hypothetical protein JWM05_730 [Acidimicrobiales bacterium]|nr:hypothetical protein [Acidimicrobiales bacterium]
MIAHRRPRVTTLGLLAGLTCTALLAACSHGGDQGSPLTGRGATSTTTTAPSGGSGLGAGPGSTPKRPGRPAAKDRLRIEVLSSQPDRVTGGDARVRIVPPPGVAPSAIRVTLGDRDVTARLPAARGALEGVLSGFVEGTSTLRATGGGDSVEQRIRDWPLEGPMISGAHLPLLACSTEQLGLGRPTDASCSAPTRISYRYVSTGHDVKPLPDPAARPPDLATARIGSRTLPLIVREETGVINRSVYSIATIDPTPGGADSHQSDAGWNGRLVYRFGGGCGTSYGQGTPLTTVEDPTLLAQGYAVATATFNTFQVQCNDVLSAETALMVKERFIEAFGVPAHTIGEGASGGAIQLHLIAQNYPGLIDGAAAILPFPDAISVAAGVADCGLLNLYYRTPAGKALSSAQRAAVNGHQTTGTCDLWETTFLGGITPSDGCDPAIPPAKIYDPVTNRGGIRCTLQDANVDQLGRDPKTGFANRPLDNVGVQYGLDALNAKQITVAQFLALNADIGGYDIDGHRQAARHAADPDAVARAYQTGRVASGGGDLTKIPIIDVNIYTDPVGDIHDRFRAFSLRDRLVGADGDPERAPGFQIWTRGGGATIASALGNIVSGGGLGPEVVRVIDRWLGAIDADRTPGSRSEKLRRNRPADAVDNCIDPATGTRVGGVGVYTRPGPCRDAFAVHGDPRTAAGAPRADDIIKCRLKPVDPADYTVPLTAADLTRLEQIFPTGVCSWRQRGIGQGPPTIPGRSYDQDEGPASRS